jgi:hemolysin activation/secretion protein
MSVLYPNIHRSNAHPLERTLACFCLWAWALSPSVVLAQADQAAAERNIQQLDQKLRERAKPKPVVQVDTLGLEASTAIKRLVSTQIQSTVLPAAIEGYWQSRLGQAVSVEQIQDFHAWFYDKAARDGFMAYAKTEVLPVNGGEELRIQVIQPKINALQVLGYDGSLDAVILQRVRSRFADQYPPGVPLDTLALDQLLDSASFDLPIELEATLRAVGPELLDMVITVTPVLPLSGSAAQQVSGLVQANNHGLRQYGRDQLMAALTLGLPSPKSQLSLLTQSSEGIAYARAEYQRLLPLAIDRGHVFGSQSRSRSILGGSASIKGTSSEVGLGITRILSGHRDLVFKGQAELATRQSDSQLQATGASLSSYRDHQLRLRVTADNERLSNFPLRAELGLTLGDYPEAINANVGAGNYSKLDWTLKGQAGLNSSGSLRLAARLRGQWANRNLDGSNQITLGGVNGVRAYTSADGAGDLGMLATLELTQTLPWNSSITLFYDHGQVETQARPTAGVDVPRDTLQGGGLQLKGQHSQFHYTLTWAKGRQGYKGWLPSNIESEPNNHRVNLTLSFHY